MVPKGEQTTTAIGLERTDTGMTTGSSDSGTAAPQPSVHADEDGSREEEDQDAAFEEVDDLADSKPRKKRKVIKSSDKKYQCPHSDCGKSYSRAEHLYRHQLNRMLSHVIA